MILSLLLAAQVAAPKTACKWPVPMIRIDLKEEIHMNVLKRTAKQCAVLYPKSPCLIKLERDEGTIDFKATCGGGYPLPEFKP